MFKKQYLAVLISAALATTYTLADQATLAEISVMAESQADRVTIGKTAFEKKQPRDLKELLADELDVQVNSLQGTRSGNDGVNIRGLQGNRVGMSLDGIPMPETQENKLFVSLGQDFGRGDFVEPTALRSVGIQYGGSAKSLSGSVSFATLEPSDVIKSGNVGGFIATGYDSVDNSVYTSLSGAARNEYYEGLVLVNGRFGNEAENHAKVGGEGSKRTLPNPADQKRNYVLVKNAVKFNEQHKLKLTFEHQQKETESELLSGNGVSIDRAMGNQRSGSTRDFNQRARLSLGHEFSSDKGWLQHASTQLYFQQSKSDNFRLRQSTTNRTRAETAEKSEKTFGLNADFMSPIEAGILQVLRYGLAYQQLDFSADIRCPSCAASLAFDPVAKTKQHKATAYIEDEILFGKFAVTPHLGLLHYRSNPSTNGYAQAAVSIAPVKKQSTTLFLPKLTLAWKVDAAFEPFVQYSRGVKTPSAQQLTSSFSNTMPTRQYAVIGNPDLRPEIADNVDLGIKGKNDAVQYRVAAFYNRYKDFIDSLTSQGAGFNPLIQYHNLDSARIYGVTANAKWNVYADLYLSGGLSYSKGNSERDGTKTPIDTIQPLKAQAGVSYEGATVGGNVQLTHVKAKSNKQISGAMYNPTSTVNIVDLGIYWKPLKSLTLTANVNNVFDKTYWNWSDISYFAVNRSAPPGSISLTKENAETYSAPGRNYNLGLRYEF